MEQLLVNDWNQVAEVELVYKSTCKASERPQLSSSEDIYNLLLQKWDRNKIELLEQFKVIFLNTANRVLAISEFSTGGIAGTIADPRLIFATALKLVATGIILAHNHPSGNLRPSRQDEGLTDKFKNGGAFLDIKVLDHLIVSNEGYYSFADMGGL